MSKLDRSLVSAGLLLKIGAWRAPIIMVDRIADFTSGIKPTITVVKHVTFNEPYIPGHFPDNPVMPGVMIAEIFGQASEYLSLIQDFTRVYQEKTGKSIEKFDDISRALKTEDGVELIITERKRIIGYLASQDVKFKHVVYPGDTLYVQSRLVFVDAYGFHHYDVEARVGRHIASSGRIINYRADRSKADDQSIFISE